MRRQKTNQNLQITGGWNWKCKAKKKAEMWNKLIVIKLEVGRNTFSLKYSINMLFFPIRNKSKNEMKKVQVEALRKWQTVVYLQLLRFYVGVTEKCHPLWLNKHSLWSWIIFLSIYTMRRSFDIPIRWWGTSLGTCSEVLPRPHTTPWVGLIIYPVGFYFERKCADLTKTLLPYPTETKKECWMDRCEYFILGFWILGFSRRCWYHDRLFFIYLFAVRFVPFYLTHAAHLEVSHLWDIQPWTIETAVLYWDWELTGLRLKGLAWLSWSLDGLVSQEHPSLVQSTDYQVFTFLQLWLQRLEDKTTKIQG